MASYAPTLSHPDPAHTGNPWLRRALGIDAAFSAAAGFALIGGSSHLVPLLGLPASLLTPAALVCLVWAVALGLLARRPRIPVPAVWAVVLGNAVWVAASIALLFIDALQPTPVGTTFLIAQAVLVALFAELQAWTARRERRLSP